MEPRFPTDEHRAAAESITSCLRDRPGVRVILLTCSCATGQAVPESCVDIAVLLDNEAPLDTAAKLKAAVAGDTACRTASAAMSRYGPYAFPDLDFFREKDIKPGYHGWCSGPDSFELMVGNYLAYSHALHDPDDAIGAARNKFLPYYSDELRASRLADVIKFCRNNLDHIEPFVRRRQYFQAHKRLMHAVEEYLQALFMQRRVYPIAYDKWIRFQLERLLGQPQIYGQLVNIVELTKMESDEMCRKGESLAAMLDGLTD